MEVQHRNVALVDPAEHIEHSLLKNTKKQENLKHRKNCKTALINVQIVEKVLIV